MQSRPYIFFYGRCEEALEFYKKALGGAYEIRRAADFPGMTPPGGQFPDNRVMHATFDAPGISFLASDGRETKAIDSEAGNISLAITTNDAAEGERVFKALSDGGMIKLPLGDAPWGEGKFGIFDDRFGIEWMVSVA